MNTTGNNVTPVFSSASWKDEMQEIVVIPKKKQTRSTSTSATTSSSKRSHLNNNKLQTKNVNTRAAAAGKSFKPLKRNAKNYNKRAAGGGKISHKARVSPPPKSESEKEHEQWNFFTHNHDSSLLDTIIRFPTNYVQDDDDDDAMSDVSGCSAAVQVDTAPAGPVLPGAPAVHRYYPLVLVDMTVLLSEPVVVGADYDDVPLVG